MRLLTALLISLTLCACGQSHADAMKIVCEAPNLPEAQGADPSSRAMVLATHIKENVTNQEVLEMFKTLATMRPEAREDVMREATARAGLASCPMIDAMGEKPESASP